MHKLISQTGKASLSLLKKMNYLLAISWNILLLSSKASSWTRAVRAVFARQILFTGVEGMGFISIIAFMVGLSVVVQAQLWFKEAGQSELLGGILVAVIVREVAPLLTNLAVIARSGTAIAAELANMRVSGEIEVLESQGIDPLMYIVLPRVLGVSVSVFCLTIVFICISFLSGYWSGIFMQTESADFTIFCKNLLFSIKPSDIYNLLAKTFTISFLTGIICSLQGLHIRGYITEVPQAATRAMEYSIGSLFVVSAFVSVITYM